MGTVVFYHRYGGFVIKCKILPLLLRTFFVHPTLGLFLFLVYFYMNPQFFPNKNENVRVILSISLAKKCIKITLEQKSLNICCKIKVHH